MSGTAPFSLRPAEQKQRDAKRDDKSMSHRSRHRPTDFASRQDATSTHDASLSLATTEQNIRLHLQFTVYDERRHPFLDIFSHDLPYRVGQS